MPDFGVHPAAPGQPSLWRHGFPEWVTHTSPAAGADFSADKSGVYISRLLTVTCRLVTDANVASREVVLQYVDPNGVVYGFNGAATTIPASQTYDYKFSVWAGTDIFPVDTGIIAPLDPVLIPASWYWKLHVVNVQATDALTRIRVYRELFDSDSPVPGRERGV